MTRTLTTWMAALALAGTAPAQDVQVHALFLGWGTQMLDDHLRQDKSLTPYYSLGGTAGAGSSNSFRENGFTVRRMEIYVAAKLSDEVSANVMFDPNQPSPILYDAFLTYRPHATWEIKVGQFKPLQTFEATSVSSADLRFVDRSQLARWIGDPRDRGLTLAWSFGDPKGISGKVTIGVFNGETGRVNDANAQKDWVGRLDFTAASVHRFGLYALEGRTNLSDKPGSPLVARTFSGPGAPTPEQVLAARDRTTNLGAYYDFTRGPWHADAEFATGRVGRRFPSLYNAPLAPTDTPAAKRQHLDQAYLGWVLSGTYTHGRHTLGIRRDFMDYNLGHRWTTDYDPYTQVAPGVTRPDGADLTPRFSETTLGYTCALHPERLRGPLVRVNLIHRSRNILLPPPGESGERGGDSLVLAFQAWF